jgi:hypothetical protein
MEVDLIEMEKNVYAPLMTRSLPLKWANSNMYHHPVL